MEETLGRRWALSLLSTPNTVTLQGSKPSRHRGGVDSERFNHTPSKGASSCRVLVIRSVSASVQHRVSGCRRCISYFHNETGDAKMEPRSPARERVVSSVNVYWRVVGACMNEAWWLVVARRLDDCSIHCANDDSWSRTSNLHRELSICTRTVSFLHLRGLEFCLS
jgi:hypothetical protein